mmetsp:Transcript_11130/g.26893  ORF Transcript_11130/g.26893 Transcript_11130/m.26893 type:complete len:344 (-) Transcript_11130:444-1475(-)
MPPIIFSISALFLSSDWRPPRPPNCSSICGFIWLAICAALAPRLRGLSAPRPVMSILPNCFITLPRRWYSCRKKTSSCGCTPLPRAMRRRRCDAARSCAAWPWPPSVMSRRGSSSSASVIESMITMYCLMRACAAPSPPGGSMLPAAPGIMPSTLPIGPMPSTISYCSRMSRSENWPCPRRSIIACCFSTLPGACVTVSNSVSKSPMPSSRCTKRRGSNRSRSCICSPVPRNAIGAPVVATAVSAPPPFAWPSTLVITTLPTRTASWNAAACARAAWPIDASTMNTVSSGCTASSIWRISSNSAASCRWRPLVSTSMRSQPSARHVRTPSRATRTGSVCVASP